MFSIQPGSSSSQQPHKEETLPILWTRKRDSDGSSGLPNVPQVGCGRPRLLQSVAQGPGGTARARQRGRPFAWGLDGGWAWLPFPRTRVIQATCQALSTWRSSCHSAQLDQPTPASHVHSLGSHKNLTPWLREQGHEPQILTSALH